ncbi:MAG: hypothetical protein KGY56_06410 [Desulfobacterales bacterium]|nr:hypothetical protein [Desulfobacterales bacterium]
MNSRFYPKAWHALESAVVEHNREPVGTLAARDPDALSLNYDQVFTREFAVSAVPFRLNSRADFSPRAISRRSCLHWQTEDTDVIGCAVRVGRND